MSKIARVYMRVTKENQELERQNLLVEEAKSKGYYIAGVYSEKSFGARLDRPELKRLINDLQSGDVVIAEHIERLSRLTLTDSGLLVKSIKEKGAFLSIPGIIELPQDLEPDTWSYVVMLTAQELVLNIVLQSSREDYLLRRRKQAEGITIAKNKGKYKGRKKNRELNKAFRVLCAHHIKRGNKPNISQLTRDFGISRSQGYILTRDLMPLSKQEQVN